jgi:hypothetical protein
MVELPQFGRFLAGSCGLRNASARTALEDPHCGSGGTINDVRDLDLFFQSNVFSQTGIHRLKTGHSNWHSAPVFQQFLSELVVPLTRIVAGDLDHCWHHVIPLLAST